MRVFLLYFSHIIKTRFHHTLASMALPEPLTATPGAVFKLPASALDLIPLEYLRQTHENIKPYIVRTPVITNEYLQNRISEAAGHEVKLYFKSEVLQRTGAFKVRGALNAVITAKKARENLPGVVTHSSGNHGAATAYAAMKLGVKCTVVVPSFATGAKLANIEQYGAEIVKVAPTPAAMKEAYERIVAERNYSLIYPYNQKEIMAGQATCALEFIEDVPQLEAMLACVSGGGWIAGLALGAKHLNPNIKVFGVAPAHKKLGEALKSGVVPDHWSPDNFIETQCDALKAHPGNLTFPVMCELLEKEAFDVTDADAATAMKHAWQRLKLVVELSSATCISAILSDEFINAVKTHKLRHIGIVLSGGNADIDAPLPWTYLKKE